MDRLSSLAARLTLTLSLRSVSFSRLAAADPAWALAGARTPARPAAAPGPRHRSVGPARQPAATEWISSNRTPSPAKMTVVSKWPPRRALDELAGRRGSSNAAARSARARSAEALARRGCGPRPWRTCQRPSGGVRRHGGGDGSGARPLVPVSATDKSTVRPDQRPGPPASVPPPGPVHRRCRRPPGPGQWRRRPPPPGPAGASPGSDVAPGLAPLRHDDIRPDGDRLARPPRPPGPGRSACS